MPFDLLAPAALKSELGQLAEKAADWLETHEWCQGATFLGPEGQQLLGHQTDYERVGGCLIGAIYHATRDKAPGKEGVIKSSLIAKAMGFRDGHATMRWNDEPGRTKEEVIARLRAVP